jgi:hypothetical protein
MEGINHHFKSEIYQTPPLYVFETKKPPHLAKFLAKNTKTQLTTN